MSNSEDSIVTYTKDEDEDKEEEEEHSAPADSIPPPPVHHTTTRISIPVQAPTPLWSEAEINRLLAIPSPPPSPLSLCPTYPLGYRAAMIWLRAKTPSTSHPPPPIVLPHTRASAAMLRAAAPSTYILAPQSETPPSGTPPLLPIHLPTSSPPLLLPSTSHRADVPEVTLPPQKRLCITLSSRYEVGESSSAPIARPIGGFRVDYGFIASLDDEIRCDPERDRMLDFVTTVRQDTDEIYGRLDDAQDDKLLMSGQLNMLRRDICAHARTTRLIETEARLSRQAWVQSMDASDTARTETQMEALQRQQGPAKGPTHPKAPKEAENSTKRTTRSTLASTTTTTTTVADAQLKALIDQGVTNALAAHDADRSQNGKDNHDSGMGVGRQAPPARECTYQDFIKCKPLSFKSTEGVIELTHWMFPEELDKIKRYIGSLPDMIHGSVMASKTKSSKPKVGHLARDCRSATNANTSKNQRGTRADQKPICFECGAQGHFKRECPKLKNNNHGNQARNGNAPAKVYAVGYAGTISDSNFVTGTFLLNNRYASILFNTGADRSFVSTAFSYQIDITQLP
nr:hypothetical protein [Tanacetum cinerariifolium]